MNNFNEALDTDEIGLLLIAFAMSQTNHLTAANLDNVVSVSEEEAVDTAALIKAGVIEQELTGWTLCDELKSSVVEVRARFVQSVANRNFSTVEEFASARDFWISWEWNNYIEG